MRKQRGYTLIELMVVVAVTGFLAALSAPNLIRVRDQMRSRSGVDETNAIFRRARSLAVATGRIHFVVISQREAPEQSDFLVLYDMTNMALPTANEAFQAATLSPDQRKGKGAPPAGMAVAGVVELPSAAGLGPPAGSQSFITVPYPFNTIPRASSCTFCSSGVGAAFFMPDGKIVFSDGNNTLVDVRSGSVTMSPRDQWAQTPPQGLYTITLLSGTGMSRVWK